MSEDGRETRPIVDDEVLVRIRLHQDGPERERERKAVAEALLVISQNALTKMVAVKADEDRSRVLRRIESGITAMQLTIRAATKELHDGAREELATFLSELAASLVDIGDEVVLLASL